MLLINFDAPLTYEYHHKPTTETIEFSIENTLSSLLNSDAEKRLFEASNGYLAARAVAERAAVPHCLDNGCLQRCTCRGNGLVLGHVGQELQPVSRKSIRYRSVV